MVIDNYTRFYMQWEEETGDVLMLLQGTEEKGFHSRLALPPKYGKKTVC